MWPNRGFWCRVFPDFTDNFNGSTIQAYLGHYSK
jgi:hypothetical protein